jgi:hypothetical protein
MNVNERRCARCGRARPIVDINPVSANLTAPANTDGQKSLDYVLE